MSRIRALLSLPAPRQACVSLSNRFTVRNRTRILRLSAVTRHVLHMYAVVSHMQVRRSRVAKRANLAGFLIRFPAGGQIERNFTPTVARADGLNDAVRGGLSYQLMEPS